MSEIRIGLPLHLVSRSANPSETMKELLFAITEPSVAHPRAMRAILVAVGDADALANDGMTGLVIEGLAAGEAAACGSALLAEGHRASNVAVRQFLQDTGTSLIDAAMCAALSREATGAAPTFKSSELKKRYDYRTNSVGN